MSGYVVVDGHKIPVVEIRLARGKMALKCEAQGPLPPYSGEGSVTVFGEDGIGVCQGYCYLAWVEVRACDLLTLNVFMDMDRCYGDAELPGVSV